MSTIAEPVIEEESHLNGAWGLSTSVDLRDCDAHSIRNPELIEQFVYFANDSNLASRWPRRRHHVTAR
jgi:hypothetical protein